MKKSEEVKVRVDPLTKNTLVQIAERETLDLSDILRFAIRDFINSRTRGQQPNRDSYVNS